MTSPLATDATANQRSTSSPIVRSLARPALTWVTHAADGIPPGEGTQLPHASAPLPHVLAHAFGHAPRG